MGDPPDRLSELLHVGDPALQQVARAAPGGKQFGGLFDLSVRGQEQDAHLREFGAQHQCRVQACGQVTCGHPDINNGQVRAFLANQGQQPRRILRLPRNVEAGPIQQARDSLPQQRVVVGENDARAKFAAWIPHVQ
jgi:hypothetical protein